jgi:hypothetical protein
LKFSPMAQNTLMMALRAAGPWPALFAPRRKTPTFNAWTINL